MIKRITIIYSIPIEPLDTSPCVMPTGTPNRQTMAYAFYESTTNTIESAAILLLFVHSVADEHNRKSDICKTQRIRKVDIVSHDNLGIDIFAKGVWVLGCGYGVMLARYRLDMIHPREPHDAINRIIDAVIYNKTTTQDAILQVGQISKDDFGSEILELFGYENITNFDALFSANNFIHDYEFATHIHEVGHIIDIIQDADIMHLKMLASIATDITKHNSIMTTAPQKTEIYENSHGRYNEIFNLHIWPYTILTKQRVPNIRHATISANFYDMAIYDGNTKICQKKLDAIHSKYSTGLYNCWHDTLSAFCGVFGYHSMGGYGPNSTTWGPSHTGDISNMIKENDIQYEFAEDFIDTCNQTTMAEESDVEAAWFGPIKCIAEQEFDDNYEDINKPRIDLNCQ